jgi:amino acid transporter
MKKEASNAVTEGQEKGKKDNRELTKPASILHIVAMTFFYVCAGPYGQGEAIGAGGAKWTFVFTLITPFVFSLPVALISSEQASRMPQCGGCCEWGFILGWFVGFNNVYVRLLCNFFDSPIYPVMTADYLADFWPELEDHIGYRFLVVAVVNVIVILLNVSGLEVVGLYSFILTFIIISPFVLFFGFGAQDIRSDLVFAEKDVEMYGEVDWFLLLSTLIWQYSGWDTVAALAEETKNPNRTFPIGMGVTVVLVTAVYVLPTVSGVCTEPDLQVWEDSAFSAVAWRLPFCESGWLSHWITFAGGLSALSLLNVAVSCTGRELYAGGCLDTLPFSKLWSRLDPNMKGEPTPICSLVFTALLTVPFSFFDFEVLVEWSGLLTVLMQLVQFAAFIACRFPSMMEKYMKSQNLWHKIVLDKPDELSAIDEKEDLNLNNQEEPKEEEIKMVTEEELKDKFVIPGGWVGVVITLLPVCAISCFLIVVSGWLSIGLSFAMLAGMWAIKYLEIGVLKLMSYCKRRNARARIDTSSPGVAVPAKADSLPEAGQEKGKTTGKQGQMTP